MTPSQAHWITETCRAAQDAHHVFPLMAACEAALESDYGQSFLAKDGCNLFGMKQHQHPEFGTITLPTREFLQDKGWQTVEARWVKYPDAKSCFSDRMITLQRLQNRYPNYGAALRADSPETYIWEVSKTWATDPKRGQNVFNCYREYRELTGCDDPTL